MKKRLLGVLLALVALGAMAGSAFAAQATGSWDITVDVLVSGDTYKTLTITAPTTSEDMTSKDFAPASWSAKGTPDTSSIPVSTDAVVSFDIATDNASMDVELVDWWVGTASKDKAPVTITEASTIYLQLSADIGGDYGFYVVELSFTIDDGSSVTPTPTEEKQTASTVKATAVTTTVTEKFTAIIKALGRTASLADLSASLTDLGTTELNTVSADAMAKVSADADVFFVGKATIPSDGEFYSFKVDLTTGSTSTANLAGKKLQLWVYIFDTTGAVVDVDVVEIAAAKTEQVDPAYFVTSDGTLITALSSTNASDVNVLGDFSAYQGDTVAPFVVATAHATSQTDPTSGGGSGGSTSPKSGNSGCDMGMGGFALLLAAALPLLRKVR